MLPRISGTPHVEKMDGLVVLAIAATVMNDEMPLFQ
jgi:hypothetical protein